MVEIKHLLTSLPARGPAEHIDELWTRPGVRVERIVSWGHSTPAGQWYDQEQDEWVVVMAGAARLSIEHEGVHDLRPGDGVLLPAHCRHRVEWTDPDRATVWLAVHCWPA